MVFDLNTEVRSTSDTLHRAIADPRCAFTIEKGFVIITVFATEALVNIWKSQMVYPDTPAVRRLMEEMGDKNIGFNIELRAIQ
jgi:hypothetical protein